MSIFWLLLFDYIVSVYLVSQIFSPFNSSLEYNFNYWPDTVITNIQSELDPTGEFIEAFNCLNFVRILKQILSEIKSTSHNQIETRELFGNHGNILAELIDQYDQTILDNYLTSFRRICFVFY